MFRNNRTQSLSNDIEREDKPLTFFDMFTNAFTCMLALVLIYSVVYMAFFKSETQSTNIMLDNILTTAVAGGSKNDATATSSNTNSVTTDDKNTADDSSGGSPSEASTTKAANVIPTTTAEIAAYYKNAVNKVKKSSKSVLCPWKITTNYNDVVETGNNKFLADTIKSLMKANMKEETSTTPFTTRESIKANFPPKDVTCNLKTEDIKKAACTEKDGYYHITLDLKSQTNPQPGYGVGSVFNILTENDITDNSPIKVSNIGFAYESGRIEAKIQKSTGNLVNLSTKLPTVMSLTALGVDCKLGLLMEEKWQINW